MKKLLLCMTLVLMAGCADLSQYTSVDSNSTAKAKMRACLISEANSRFQSGTLFAQGITATSKQLVSVCMQKLALQSAGISEESQSTAATIIQNLQNYGSAY